MLAIFALDRSILVVRIVVMPTCTAILTVGLLGFFSVE